MKCFAVEIFELFLTEDSPYQLNITEKKIAPIRKILLNSLDDITQELYQSIKFEVDHLLVDCFQRFKTSVEFQMYFYKENPKRKTSFTKSSTSLSNLKKRSSGNRLIQFVANVAFQKGKSSNSLQKTNSKSINFKEFATQSKFVSKNRSLSELPNFFETPSIFKTKSLTFKEYETE